MGIDLLDMVTMDDLDGKSRELAERYGLETFKTMVRQEGGWALHVPSEETVTRNLRNRLIKAEFNGGNAKALGRKYNLSKSAMTKLINNIVRESAQKQTSLWGDGS